MNSVFFCCCFFTGASSELMSVSDNVHNSTGSGITIHPKQHHVHGKSQHSSHSHSHHHVKNPAAQHPSDLPSPIMDPYGEHLPDLTGGHHPQVAATIKDQSKNSFDLEHSSLPSTSSSSSSVVQSPQETIDPTGKRIKFDEEPEDSFIVKGKSAVLRCKTLHALNAWFSCNSGK